MHTRPLPRLRLEARLHSFDQNSNRVEMLLKSRHLRATSSSLRGVEKSKVGSLSTTSPRSLVIVSVYSPAERSSRVSAFACTFTPYPPPSLPSDLSINHRPVQYHLDNNGCVPSSLEHQWHPTFRLTRRASALPNARSRPPSQPLCAKNASQRLWITSNKSLAMCLGSARTRSLSL